MENKAITFKEMQVKQKEIITSGNIKTTYGIIGCNGIIPSIVSDDKKYVTKLVNKLNRKARQNGFRCYRIATFYISNELMELDCQYKLHLIS